MIVPIKKATILFETNDAEETILHLRRLGVLQVEHQNLPEGRGISALQEKVSLIHSSFDVLASVMEPEKKTLPQKKISGDWMALAGHIIELGKRQERLESSSRTIMGQIQEWERWGDIDLDQVQEMGQHGIYLKLYQVPVIEIGNFPDDVAVKIILTTGDIANCLAISRRQFECSFTEITPPKHRVSVLKKHLAENHEQLKMIEREIIESACFYEDLTQIKEKLEKEIEFQQVLHGRGREGAISFITGYIPFDTEGPLVAEARNRKWGILVSEPSALDDVPTLLRNPRWVSRINPVLELLGITPGYRELDVSMLFLIFFSIFFGILIGDAGYGLAYILITLGLQKTKKLSAEIKTIVPLFYLLGCCAVLWGSMTGTFFGQEWFQNLGYTPLVPQLNDTTVMQLFCFFLGAFHLSLAHSWRAFLKFPSPTALADIGWICILWSAFFVAGTLVLGEAFPSWGIWLVVTGIVLVMLFTNPQTRILKRIGDGLRTVLLSFMNNYTDVISYVRLFAVGLATLAIAETTNSLALGFGNGALAILGGTVIILIGHSLNIILGPMSVLVHGVRLNVLEFSGHANVTWSGTAFRPFKE